MNENARTDVHLVWLTGPSCDGCTVSVIGDTTVATFEELLQGRVAGLPRVRLVHTALSFEQGESYLDLVRRAERGELDPFVLVVEASIPQAAPGGGSYAWKGSEGGRLVDVREWVRRLGPRASAVLAVGDCGVFGGPHSEGSNPSGAAGVESVLGERYRSRFGLPVVNLPGCAVPPVVLATLAAVLRRSQGQGPALDLDELGRPRFAYPD